MAREPNDARTTRRRLLHGTASASLAATAGCLDGIWNIAGRTRAEQLSLRIKTLPTDADPYAIRIARALANGLEAVGIETELLPMAEEALLRDLLVNHDFDLYVAPSPGGRDPDFLRPFLHSRYAGEQGWQNPFGYTDLSMDELLDEQRRREGDARRRVVVDLQMALVEAQPCTVVAFPDDVIAIRTDRFSGWKRLPPTTPLGYIALDAVGGVPRDALRVLLRDARATRNLNPLAAEHRDRGTITGLVYDSLGRVHDDTVRPWLAAGWTWTDDDRRAEMSLRRAYWHDGTPVTARDVAFTYRFLADTSLGEADAPVPAERFRGEGSLVADVSAVDERVVEFAFDDVAPSIAERAFTVPVLPRHVWREYTDPATVAGVSVGAQTTEALVWENPNPIGSGPLRIEAVERDERIVLARVEDHFLGRVEGDLGAAVGDRLAFDRAVFRPVPSDSVAVELLAEGRADASASPLSSAVAPDIGRAAALSLIVHPSASFYHVGYNVRRAPLSNLRFRRAVARLLDRAHIVESVFDGYATPAVSPLATTDWLAPELTWDDEAPVLPFVGEDGELDVERARDLFVEAGFRYQEGRLLQG
ncbi:ABC transporter substrate-binding protein [Halomarina halobia]|uniref:ABC transporter substrate-binding protein n=1 Tax=Halomarina halobia TaxID=3033386 RepID=A0ABD6A6X5_9EURY|nr:ABC transporter substrate-binding protein [Halomarina sp. PSR21]